LAENAPVADERWSSSRVLRAVLINGALIASLFLVIAVGDRLGGAWVLLFPAWLLVLFAAAMLWLRRHPPTCAEEHSAASPRPSSHRSGRRSSGGRTELCGHCRHRLRVGAPAPLWTRAASQPPGSL